MPSATPTITIPRIGAPDFTRDLDISTEELVQLLSLAADVKRSPRAYAACLEHQSIALLFEKPSLRTKLTFELAIRQLGGSSIASDGPIAHREPIKDVARNLDRWVNAIVARTFRQDTVDDLARYSSVPVINALSDRYHPCQALADVLTLTEQFGSLAGVRLTFVGDGNNVAHSLMLCAVRLGANFTIATPPGFEPDPAVLDNGRALAAVSGASVSVTNDPEEAVTGADAVYTDVWTSMGQEAQANERRRKFQPYQMNGRLYGMALPGARFMHCLPAKRGEEVTDEVIESPGSVVFDQAENRLHAQKALLLMMMA